MRSTSIRLTTREPEIGNTTMIMSMTDIELFDALLATLRLLITSRGSHSGKCGFLADPG